MIVDLSGITTEPNFSGKSIFLMKISNKITKKPNIFLTFRFCVRVSGACVRSCTIRLRLRTERVRFLLRPNSAAKLFFSITFFQTFPKTISLFPIQHYFYFNWIISIGLDVRVIVWVSIHKVWISAIWHLAQTHAHVNSGIAFVLVRQCHFRLAVQSTATELCSLRLHIVWNPLRGKYNCSNQLVK